MYMKFPKESVYIVSLRKALRQVKPAAIALALA
jgi:hypothetical protein